MADFTQDDFDSLVEQSDKDIVDNLLADSGFNKVSDYEQLHLDLWLDGDDLKLIKLLCMDRGWHRDKLLEIALRTGLEAMKGYIFAVDKHEDEDDGLDYDV